MLNKKYSFMILSLAILSSSQAFAQKGNIEGIENAVELSGATRETACADDSIEKQALSILRQANQVGTDYQYSEAELVILNELDAQTMSESESKIQIGMIEKGQTLEQYLADPATLNSLIAETQLLSTDQIADEFILKEIFTILNTGINLKFIIENDDGTVSFTDSRFKEAFAAALIRIGLNVVASKIN